MKTELCVRERLGESRRMCILVCACVSKQKKTTPEGLWSPAPGALQCLNSGNYPSVKYLIQ